ncbi:MAG: 23S rRNA (uracil-C(5))-methyltransferase RlmCD [Gemmatimonadaceae bacterium]|nr:23S rRNA (uracil-C(5))-methyltransferase RlmCD [Gemmatimonadaceae bacterium]
MSSVAELSIDSIAAGGDGVARSDGLVVFVPRTAPGDRIAARIDSAGRFARGRLQRLIQGSVERTDPVCRHYDGDDCGGCQLQHMSYDAQLRAKRGIVNDALERIARVPNRVEDVMPSPSPWRYRRKLTLAIRRRAHGPPVVGLRNLANPDDVFDLHECPITDPRIVASWREAGLVRHLLPDERTLSGAIRLDGDSLVLVLNGGRTWPSAAAFAAACPSLAAVHWYPHGGGHRVVVDRRADGTPVASFQQVNLAVASLLRSAVVNRVMRHAPETVIDGYAGSGENAIALHERGVRVTAIEMDREASAYSARFLTAPSKAVAARLEDALASALPASVVILNPPRAGVAAVVCQELERARDTTRAILYASCNPATLARDIQRLPSYRIAWIVAFDMFPQTAHVETVCELVPEVS